MENKELTERKRTLALAGHGGSGKTSLAEALLHTAGSLSRLGSVDEGTAVLDFGEEELKRKMSIDIATGRALWQKHPVELIDIPGYPDFIGELRTGLPAADGCVIVVSASDGVQVGTESAWNLAEEIGIARMFFVNKLDKENADFAGAVKGIQEQWGKRVVAIQMPVGKEKSFAGVVDLLLMKARMGSSGELADVPSEFKNEAEALRAHLLEAVAESDDELLEKYLETGDLAAEEVLRGLRAGVVSGSIIPVLCGSATGLGGITALLDAIVSLFPSPLERRPVRGRFAGKEEEAFCEPRLDGTFCAYVFKSLVEPHLGELSFFRVYSGRLEAGSSVWNASRGHEERIGQMIFMQGKTREEVREVGPGDIAVVAKLTETFTSDTLGSKASPFVIQAPSLPGPVISVAIVPESKKDQERLGTSLARLAAGDPTINIRVDQEFSQTVLAGQGEVQLDVVVERLKNRYGVNVRTEKTKIPYRETVRGTAKAQGKYKRQSGGRGQYGDAWLEVTALARGAGFEFVDSIVGGSVPSKYIPAIEKGVREASQKGVLAGYPVVDVRVSVYDGSFHPVDSSDMAFQIAGSLGFKKAVQEAQVYLVEPIVEIEAVVPEQYLGDITSDLNGRRGRILGIEAAGGNQRIKAQVPLSEMDRYATDLKSITQGRGSYAMRFSHYDEVPARFAADIVARSGRKEEEAQ